MNQDWNRWDKHHFSFEGEKGIKNKKIWGGHHYKGRATHYETVKKKKNLRIMKDHWGKKTIEKTVSWLPQKQHFVLKYIPRSNSMPYLYVENSES